MLGEVWLLVREICIGIEDKVEFLAAVAWQILAVLPCGAQPAMHAVSFQMLVHAFFIFFYKLVTWVGGAGQRQKNGTELSKVNADNNGTAM